MGLFETSKMYKKGSPEVTKEDKDRMEKARLERLANAPESRKAIENLQKEVDKLPNELVEEDRKAWREAEERG
ncbi:MAG: hypothetical protein Q7S73_02670 [bacterium]|nr:hypothetical protein [bacterium]